MAFTDLSEAKRLKAVSSQQLRKRRPEKGDVTWNQINWLGDDRGVGGCPCACLMRVWTTTMTLTVLEVRLRYLAWLRTWVHSAQGFIRGGGGSTVWIEAGVVQRSPTGRLTPCSCRYASPHNRSSAGVWRRSSPSRRQPLWMYFLMTTQPCLKSGQGRDCRSVQVLVQGSKVSMLLSAGPSLLTMPPVA